MFASRKYIGRPPGSLSGRIGGLVDICGAILAHLGATPSRRRLGSLAAALELFWRRIRIPWGSLGPNGEPRGAPSRPSWGDIWDLLGSL